VSWLTSPSAQAPNFSLDYTQAPVREHKSHFVALIVHRVQFDGLDAVVVTRHEPENRTVIPMQLSERVSGADRLCAAASFS
jgi:hypothetical protein